MLRELYRDDYHDLVNLIGIKMLVDSLESMWTENWQV
jgi:hypothetical protein